jgi:hypothetical protein
MECSIDCLPIRDISVVSIVLYSGCSLMYLNISFVPTFVIGQQMQFLWFQQCEIVYNLNCYRIGLGHIFVLDSLVLVYLRTSSIACFFPLNKDMKSGIALHFYNNVHKYHLLKHCISTS